MDIIVGGRGTGNTVELIKEMLGELQEGSEEYNNTLASIEEYRNAIQEAVSLRRYHTRCNSVTGNKQRKSRY